MATQMSDQKVTDMFSTMDTTDTKSRADVMPCGTGWVLLILVLIAGGWRLAHLRAVYLEYDYLVPAVWTHTDMHAFMQWSDAILAGDILGRDTYHPNFDWLLRQATTDQWYQWWGGKEIFHQEPLYPYFVALVRFLSNGSLLAPLVIQLIIGSLHPLILFFLGRRLCDDRVGLMAAAMAAIYGPFIFYEGILLRDWLSPMIEPLVLLTLIAASGMRSRQWWFWLLPGLILGIAVLARTFILLFLPGTVLWIILLRYSRRWRGFQAVGMFCAGLIIALSPLMVRNLIVGAPIMAIHNRTAEGLILGNTADGSPVGLVYPKSQIEILKTSGGSVPSVLWHTLKTHEGVGSFFQHQLTKFRGIFEPYDIPDNATYANSRDHSPALQLSLSFWPLAAVGVSGMILSCWWRNRNHLLVMVYFFSILAALMTVTAIGRYRLSLAPVLMIYAAILLIWMFDWLRSRRWKAATIGLLVTIVFIVIQYTIVPIKSLRADPFFPLSRREFLAVNRLLGIHLMEQGHYYDALIKFNNTIIRVPEYDPGYYHRGRLLLLLNDPASAEADFTRTLELDPDFTAGFIYRGRARYQLGNNDMAMSDFNRAIELDSRAAEAYYHRGRLHLQRRLNIHAIDDFTRAIRINPNDAVAYHDRAIAWYRAGDPAKCIADAQQVEQLGGLLSPHLQQLLNQCQTKK